MKEIKKIETVIEDRNNNSAHKHVTLINSFAIHSLSGRKRDGSRSYWSSCMWDVGKKTLYIRIKIFARLSLEIFFINLPNKVEAFCSTYNIDLFVVAYSVVDRKSFKTAEHILIYLKDNEMMLTRGVILVGNKTDLERHREVPIQGIF